MPLAADVQARYSAQFLISLTNPDDSAATTINSTTLGYAVSDAQADFELYAEQTYNSAEEQHVVIATQGVIAYLQERMGQTERAQAALERFWDRCQRLAKVTVRARHTPTTTDENTNQKGRFDRDRFGDFILDAPPPITRDLLDEID